MILFGPFITTTRSETIPNVIRSHAAGLSFLPSAVHTHSLSTVPQGDIYYPLTRSEREAFRTEAGKRVPPHHWAVYDLVRTIPAGRVSTYKDVCVALGQGSPRSVGGALRNNPFAPCIPCHRVIASSFFVGGFKGEWAASSAAAAVAREDSEEDSDENGAKIRNWHKPFRGGGMGPLQNEKLRMLVREGVVFGKGGKMSVGSDAVLWRFDADGRPGADE